MFWACTGEGYSTLYSIKNKWIKLLQKVRSHQIVNSIFFLGGVCQAFVLQSVAAFKSSTEVCNLYFSQQWQNGTDNLAE